MCAVIVDYNGGFIFFAAVQKFIILFNHVAEDSIKVRANKKWTIKKHNPLNVLHYYKHNLYLSYLLNKWVRICTVYHLV
jgi:hypothetical protein